MIRNTRQSPSAHDSRQYNIVKVFWQPAALEQRLATLGFDISVHKTTHEYCIYGQSSRQPDSQHQRKGTVGETHAHGISRRCRGMT